MSKGGRWPEGLNLEEKVGFPEIRKEPGDVQVFLLQSLDPAYMQSPHQREKALDSGVSAP